MQSFLVLLGIVIIASMSALSSIVFVRNLTENNDTNNDTNNKDRY